MQADFAKALPRILVYEGGRSDNPLDPGGRTNKGITQTTFNAYLRENDQAVRDVYDITKDEVATIYKNRYWDMVRGDDLPAGLDLVVFDAGVNSGVGQAGKWLQRALGDKFTGMADGLIGPKTLQAIEDYGDVEALIDAVCSRRLATLKSLRTWSTFGDGWHARIANVMKTGQAWASGAEAPHPVDVSRTGGRKAPISDIKVSPISQAATHAATAAAGAGAAASSAAQQLQPLQQFNFKYLASILAILAAASVVAGIVVSIISNIRSAAEQGTSTAAVNPDADAGAPAVVVNDKSPPPVNILPPPAKVA